MAAKSFRWMLREKTKPIPIALGPPAFRVSNSRGDRRATQKSGFGVSRHITIPKRARLFDDQSGPVDENKWVVDKVRRSTSAVH